MELTVEQRIQRESLAVMTHHKYRSLGGVIMMGVTRIEDDAAKCPTAYTDGLNTVYGRAFMGAMPPAEIRFLILHETMHKALRHMITWQGIWKEDAKTANLACDYVINLLLMMSDAGEGFIKMPPNGALDQKYQGMDAGEVYRMLKAGGQTGNEPKGFDAHGWEEAQGMTPAEVAALGKEVESALQQGSILKGKMAGGLDRAVQEVLAPTVDWREVLRDFVTASCGGKDLSTWRRPNRRLIDSGIYMPSSISETVGRVGIGADASGSVTGKIQTRFISEVVGIALLVKPELIDLLYWDSRVAAHEKYAEGQYEMLAQSTKPKGGGGTSPSCVTKYLADNRIKPECFIMLTDGEVGNDWGGAWPCPVLWCITSKRITAKTGKTIYIGD